MSVNPDHIFLTDGASVGVRMSLNALIRGPNDSIMVPVPQYPLYSASVALYNGNFVGYELDEGNGWGMDVNDLQVSRPVPPAFPPCLPCATPPRACTCWSMHASYMRCICMKRSCRCMHDLLTSLRMHQLRGYKHCPGSH